MEGRVTSDNTESKSERENEGESKQRKRRGEVMEGETDGG